MPPILVMRPRSDGTVSSGPAPGIAALDADAIQRAAQRYLDTGNDVKVVLLPESKYARRYSPLTGPP